MCSEPAGRAVLVALLVATGVTIGCGKKGDPLPPVSLVPRAAQDLALRQQGTDLLLRVSYPSLTASGVPLPGLEAMEVLRLVRPLPAQGEPAPPDPRQFAPAATLVRRLGPEELPGATAGGELHLRLPLPSPAGTAREAHTLAVRFVGKGGLASDLSNLVTVVPASPPPPPGGLSVEPTAAGIEVSWDAAGQEIGSYRVYRRRAQERSYGPPLATLSAGTTSYLDASARFGERYIYAVTAATVAAPTGAEGAPAAPGGQRQQPAPGAERPPAGAESAPAAPSGQRQPSAAGAESALIAEREVDYRDRFPPQAPAGLLALPEPGKVRLTWQASAEPDVAGYHVYRRELPDGVFARLTAEPQASTSFLADGLRPAASYAFRVSAVDGQGNESPPTAPVEATAL
jgi:hypothetical protein